MGSVCMKWTGELDCLKKFIECSVVGEGKWRSPGGSTKQFLSLDTDLTIIWYAHKQNSLTFNGEVGDLLREKLIQLCVDTRQRLIILELAELLYRNSNQRRAESN